MKYTIGDFIIYTDKKTEKFNEKYLVPTKIEAGRPGGYEFMNKTRDITIFSGLNFLEKRDNKHYRVISDIFDFIDLIEILKAFISNKLDTSKEYQISDKFTAEIDTLDGNVKLKIYFAHYSDSLFLDKFECASLAAKFGKILQRCEVWQDQEA